MNKVRTDNKEVGFFLLNVILFVIAFGIFITPTFNSDTIYHIQWPERDWNSYVTSGRYLTAFLNAFFCFIGYNTAISTHITVAISAVIYGVCGILIQRVLANTLQTDADMKDKVVLALILQLPIINVLMLEPMMFIELAVVYALAYLMSVLSFVCLTKNKIIWALILAECSIMLYQSHVVIGFILYSGYVYLVNKGKFSLKVFVEEVKAGLIVVAAGVINVLSVKIFGYLGILPYVSKNASLDGFWKKIPMIFDSFLDTLKDNYGLLPGNWLLMLVLVLNIVIVLWEVLKEKRYLDAAYHVVLCMGMLIVPFMFGLLQPGVALPPRIVFTIYVAVGTIIAVAYIVNSDIKKNIAAISGVVLLIIQIVMCNTISAEHVASNALDVQYMEMIYYEIQKYEEETGIEVEYVEVFHDTNCSEKYSQIKYHSFCTNRRVVVDGWSDVWFLNYISGRDFTKTHEREDEIYALYFADKNWDVFDADEQLIFEDNYLYWVIY